MTPGNERPGELRKRLAARLASPTRYQTLGEIAHGAMGRIFKVRDLELGREVAMKVLDAGAGGERLLARFLEEAQLTSQLDHPGIVPLFDVGVLADGRIYYTMPLVEGRTLDEVLRLARTASAGWSRTRVLHVLLRACEALAYAHERGVVHRDLKPANLMVGRHGEVLILDWGLARHERHARGGTLGGTPATMAPDVLEGKSEVGPLSDVYAFGAILYALCAGRLPYEDAGSKVDFNRILRGPPTPLAEIDPELPQDLIAITDKAMARDPRGRYASMEELREDLQRFLEGRIVVAHPVGRLERVRKWVRRNPQLAVGLAAGFVLLLALVLVQGEKVRSVGAAHREALRGAYLANLVAAEASLRTGESAEAKRRLDACPPDLRGWEWRFLRLQSDSSERLLGPFSDKVDAVAAASVGSTVATGSLGEVVLWDAVGGQRLAAHACGAGIASLAFSPAGDELAVGLADGTLLRLGARDLAERARTKAHDFAVSELAFAPGGRALASACQITGSVRLERAGEEARTARVPVASSLAFFGDGTLAVGSANHDVLLLDASDLSERGHLATQRVESLAAHPDGKRLAAGCFDGRVLVLDASGGAREIAPPTGPAHAGPVHSVAWDADGRVLATASEDKSIGLWSGEDGVLLARRYGHEAPVKALAFLPGGGRFASGASDGTARVWSTAGGAEATLRVHPDWVEAVAFLSGGSRLVTLDWGPSLGLWSTENGARLSSLPLEERPSSLAASPNGTRVACDVGQGVVVFDVLRGTALTTFDLSPAHALGLAYAAGDRVVARTSGGELLELSPGAAPRVVATGLDEVGRALDVAPGPNLAAVGLKDGRVLVIDLAAGETVHAWPLHAGLVSVLAFDAHGERLLAGAADRTVSVLDVATGEILATLRGHDDSVTAVGFAPDGRRLFTAAQDRTVRVWDGADLLLTLRGHSQWITDLAIEASGACLASASQDGTVHLWRAGPEGGPR